MITACMPLSRKYSPMVQPVNGARNCIGAGSEAVAATTIEYSSAPRSSSTLHELGDGRALLADGDVDAVELLALVVALR